MGFGGGAGDVAAHLLTAHPGGRVKGEEAIGRIAGLLLQLIEGDAAPVHPGGGAGFEPVGLEAELLQRFGEPFGGLFTGAAGGHRLMPHPDAAAQEGAGGEYHGLSAVDAAEIGADAADALLVAFTAGFQAGHHRFAQGEVGGVLQQLQHLAGIEALVGLGAQGPHRRAAAGVEDALLDGGGISQAPDHPTEGIHFMDELAFGGAADGRVAGLPGDAIEIEAEQGGVQAQPGGGDRRFTTGMAAADHDHVEGFGGGGAEAHASII